MFLLFSVLLFFVLLVVRSQVVYRSLGDNQSLPNAMTALLASPMLRNRPYLLLAVPGIIIFVLALIGSSWGGGLQSVSQYASNIVSSAGGEDAQVPASEAAPSPSQGRPIGVIIETSVTPNLIPLMLHFLSVLGPSWTIVLFTLESTWHLPSSPALRRAIQHKQIEIRFLPADTVLNSSGAVSTFLTGPWLWEQLLSAPRVLFFQTDSVICSNSDITVESFFDYDFLGAPIASQYGQGYNGGLSLRNPKMFLEITQMSDFKTSGESFEDQWFYKEVKKRGGALPVEDVAKTFSVETIYYEKPLGYHQPQRWQKDHMEQIEEWCPEVKMLIGRRAQ